MLALACADKSGGPPKNEPDGAAVGPLGGHRGPTGAWKARSHPPVLAKSTLGWAGPSQHLNLLPTPTNHLHCPTSPFYWPGAFLIHDVRCALFLTQLTVTITAVPMSTRDVCPIFYFVNVQPLTCINRLGLCLAWPGKMVDGR